MHDGSEDPTAICSICEDVVWLGYIKQCPECGKTYCEDCAKGLGECTVCEDCEKVVCETCIGDHDCTSDQTSQ